ncbi:DUF859 family phage minor structural protein [Peribacillus frigoritolerans]|nr:DUF859 family phage minor structural protein [Peribacillus frigoritolerans]
MALSGSFYTNVGSHWRLSIEWSATQDVANNQSDVVAKMYWEALDSYGSINSSTSKTSGIQYNGGTFSTETHTAGLNGNQKKLINTYSFTLTHDADGTKSFSLDGWFDAEITLSGNYYGRIDLTEKTFSLNTIPRKSTMTTSRSFTAGSDRTISISRYSTSFRHEVELSVGNKATDTWNWIKQVAFSTSETSKSTSFDTAEKTEIFTELNGASSKDVRMVLQTFKGDDLIGSVDYFGTVIAPDASTISSTTDRDVYIDQTIDLGITRDDSEFTHDLVITCGAFSKTITGVTTSTSWTPSASEKTSLYNETKTANSVDGNIKVTTKYNGVVVQSYTNNDINFYVRNSNPTFGTGYTYKDVNTVTTAITGDATKIVQNVSSVDVELLTGAKAVGVNGATIVNYIATLGGKSVTKPYSSTGTVTFNFGFINASTDQTLTIKAIDSRGNSTQTSKTVTMLPYSQPVITSSVTRLNGFEAQTTLTLSGSISPLTVGTQRNSLLNIAGQTAPLQYRYKENIAGAVYPATWTDFTYSTSTNTYTATNVVIADLDNTKNFIFEIRATDKLTTTTITKTVASGKPIFAIDSEKGSVGVGKFATGTGTLESAGKIIGNAGIEITDGYLEIGSYNNTSYGSGKTQLFYDGVVNALKMQARDDTNTIISPPDLLIGGKKVHHDGNIMIATGSVNITPVANTTVSVNISFGKTFPSTPSIQVTPNTGVPYTEVRGVSFSNPTTTGCTLNLNRTNTVATTLYWVAIWGG